MNILFQTELTCQRIQEFENQASSDLELRNNKIDELNRVNTSSYILPLFFYNLFLFFLTNGLKTPITKVQCGKYS